MAAAADAAPQPANWISKEATKVHFPGFDKGGRRAAPHLDVGVVLRESTGGRL